MIKSAKDIQHLLDYYYYTDKKCIKFSVNDEYNLIKDKTKEGISNEALYNEIYLRLKRELKHKNAEEQLKELELIKEDSLRFEALVDNHLEKVSYICCYIKDITRLERKICLYSHYVHDRIKTEAKYDMKLDKLTKYFSEEELDRYKLISVNENIEILEYDVPCIYDKEKERTFFLQNIPLDLILNLKNMKSTIGSLSVRLEDSYGWGEKLFNKDTNKKLIYEAFERGRSFKLTDLGECSVVKLYSKVYDDCLWIKIDKQNITFEELYDDFDTANNGKSIVTQVIHLQYVSSEKGAYFITHLDHEYIFYSYKDYENRKKDPNQKGKKMKSFKIDDAKIPFYHMCEGNKFFIYYILDSYFKHKNLLKEYFENIINH